ncbi:hypothetical protein [Lentzea sp. NPDC003310]|uniref:hypothetical protein n=1 Tax=Lentzea sp. NPDC003310 TaxID=3154447 RepID=UPI0033A0B0B5
MNQKNSAATLILLGVLSFLVALLHMGHPLSTALLAAGAGGVIAAEIAYRLLGGPEAPPPPPGLPVRLRPLT